MSDWPTKEKDIDFATQILEGYANQTNCNSLGLFELVVDQKAKCMDYQLAQWVHYLASYFKATYGEDQGNTITGKVICYWLSEGQTMH